MVDRAADAFLERLDARRRVAGDLRFHVPGVSFKGLRLRFLETVVNAVKHREQRRRKGAGVRLRRILVQRDDGRHQRILEIKQFCRQFGGGQQTSFRGFALFRVGDEKRLAGAFLFPTPAIHRAVDKIKQLFARLQQPFGQSVGDRQCHGFQRFRQHAQSQQQSDDRILFSGQTVVLVGDTADRIIILFAQVETALQKCGDRALGLGQLRVGQFAVGRQHEVQEFEPEGGVQKVGVPVERVAECLPQRLHRRVYGDGEPEAELGKDQQIELSHFLPAQKVQRFVLFDGLGGELSDQNALRLRCFWSARIVEPCLENVFFLQHQKNGALFFRKQDRAESDVVQQRDARFLSGYLTVDALELAGPGFAVFRRSGIDLLQRQRALITEFFQTVGSGVHGAEMIGDRRCEVGDGVGGGDQLDSLLSGPRFALGLRGNNVIKRSQLGAENARISALVDPASVGRDDLCEVGVGRDPEVWIALDRVEFSAGGLDAGIERSEERVRLRDAGSLLEAAAGQDLGKFFLEHAPVRDLQVLGLGQQLFEP